MERGREEAVPGVECISSRRVRTADIEGLKLTDLRASVVDLRRSGLLGRAMYDCFTEATADSVICTLSRSDVRRLILAHPYFALRIIETIGKRMVEAEGSFPSGRTTKAMNPLAGPPTPAGAGPASRPAHERFEAAYRDLAARGAPMRTTMFGAVAV